MKTAIELLLNELEEYDFKVSPSIKKRYMEMEKQQIIDAYMDRMDITDKEYFKQIIGGEYYNETYKQDI